MKNLQEKTILKRDIDLNVRYMLYKRFVQFDKGDILCLCMVNAHTEEDVGVELDPSRLVYEITYCDKPEYEGFYSYEKFAELCNKVLCE